MLVIQLKKMTITQKLWKLKIKLLLIEIMINTLLLKNIISLHQKNLLQNQHKQIQQGKVIFRNFVKKKDFDNKPKKLNKNVFSNNNNNNNNNNSNDNNINNSNNSNNNNHKNNKHVLVEHELNEVSEKVKAISTKGLTKDLISKISILNRAKYFYSGILQNYFVFIPAKKYIKYFSGTTQINSWKSSGMSENNIENTTKSGSNFAPIFVDHHVLHNINFNENCFINNKISIPKK